MGKDKRWEMTASLPTKNQHLWNQSILVVIFYLWKVVSAELDMKPPQIFCIRNTCLLDQKGKEFSKRKGRYWSQVSYDYIKLSGSCQ